MFQNGSGRLECTTRSMFHGCDRSATPRCPPLPSTVRGPGVRGAAWSSALLTKWRSRRHHPSPSFPLPVEGRGRPVSAPSTKSRLDSPGAPDCSFSARRRSAPPTLRVRRPVVTRTALWPWRSCSAGALAARAAQRPERACSWNFAKAAKKWTKNFQCIWVLDCQHVLS